MPKVAEARQHGRRHPKAVGFALVGSCLTGLLLILSYLAGCAPSAPVVSGLESLWLPQSGRSRRASTSGEPWDRSNHDSRRLEPGQTMVLADLAGPGLITHWWITVRSEEPRYARLLLVRLYWDEEPQPSVEAPLGDFYGVGHGVDRPLTSLPVRVGSDGRARNCYWPMPFRVSARLILTNEGALPAEVYSQVDWIEHPDLPRQVPYFHAQYRQEHPAAAGQRYLLAAIAGRGQYVGTLLNLRARHDGWYGEGDDFFFVDNDTIPAIRGTGTEDYFGDAWGIRQEQGPYSGATQVQISQDGLNSLYRWHLVDPIVFTWSLRAEIEHTGFIGDSQTYQERDDDLSSVAFWYQQEPHAPWPASPTGYQRLPWSGLVESVRAQGLPADQQARLVEEAYLYDRPVAAEPIWGDSAGLRAATARLRLRNSAGLPVQARGVVWTQGPVQAVPQVVEIALAPGAEETVAIELSLGDPDIAAPCPAGAIPPVLVDWTFSYPNPDGPPLEVRQRQSVVVDSRFPVARCKTPVVVDGRLEEWGALPYTATSPGQLRMAAQAWAGPEDCSFRFAVAEDENYLYLAVETIDDVAANPVDQLFWFQDGIEVRIDARPDPERSAWNGQDGEFERFLFLALAPGDSAASQVLIDRDRLPAGILAVCRRTEQGHDTEIAVPHAVLDAYRGGRWEALRLNIAVNDLDAVGGEFVQYWWRPDWRDPDSYPGSGTFLRPTSSTPARAIQARSR